MSDKQCPVCHVPAGAVHLTNCPHRDVSVEEAQKILWATKGPDCEKIILYSETGRQYVGKSTFPEAAGETVRTMARSRHEDPLRDAVQFLRERNGTGVLQYAMRHCDAIAMLIKAYDQRDFALCMTRAEAISLIDDAVRRSDVTLDFCADGILVNSDDDELPRGVTPEEADKLLAPDPRCQITPPIEPDEKWRLLHVLWTKAVGTPNYNKAEWRAMERVVLGQHADHRSIISDHRELLGRMVREAWVAWAKTQPNAKESWLVPWENLDEAQKEADRCIGDAVWRVAVHLEEEQPCALCGNTPTEAVEAAKSHDAIAALAEPRCAGVPLPENVKQLQRDLAQLAKSHDEAEVLAEDAMMRERQEAMSTKRAAVLCAGDTQNDDQLSTCPTCHGPMTSVGCLHCTEMERLREEADLRAHGLAETPRPNMQVPQDPKTQAQLAAVMLTRGTPPPQAEVLRAVADKIDPRDATGTCSGCGGPWFSTGCPMCKDMIGPYMVPFPVALSAEDMNAVLRTSDEKTTAELQAEGCTIGDVSDWLPKTSEPLICDGCNVRDGWEHRCHGRESVVRGEQTYRPCECHECNDEKIIAEALDRLQEHVREPAMEALHRFIRRAIGLEEKQRPGYMQSVRDPKISSCCTCGYSWPTGTHGEHSCSEVLFKRLTTAMSMLNSIHKICDKYVLSKDDSDPVSRVRVAIAGLKLSRDDLQKKATDFETRLKDTQTEWETVRAKFQALAHGLRGDVIALQDRVYEAGYVIERISDKQLEAARESAAKL